MFSISFNNGTVSFEISGSDQAWVDGKLEKLEELVKQSPALSKDPKVQPEKANQLKQKTPKTPRTTTKKQSKDDSTVNPLLSSAFNEALVDQINSFVSDRSKSFSKGTTKQAAILAVFLKDTLNIELISSADFEFIYRKIGWNTINHIAQLNNARIRDKFFVQNQGKLELTHNGLKFGRDTSKNSVNGDDAA